MPDKVKRLSNVIIPDAAEAPVLADAVAYLPLFTLPAPVSAGTPAPTPPLPLPPASDRDALIRLFHARWAELDEHHQLAERCAAQ